VEEFSSGMVKGVKTSGFNKLNTTEKDENERDLVSNRGNSLKWVPLVDQYISLLVVPREGMDLDRGKTLWEVPLDNSANQRKGDRRERRLGIMSCKHQKVA